MTKKMASSRSNGQTAKTSPPAVERVGREGRGPQGLAFWIMQGRWIVLVLGVASVLLHSRSSPITQQIVGLMLLAMLRLHIPPQARFLLPPVVWRLSNLGVQNASSHPPGSTSRAATSVWLCCATPHRRGTCPRLNARATTHGTRLPRHPGIATSKRPAGRQQGQVSKLSLARARRL